MKLQAYDYKHRPVTRGGNYYHKNSVDERIAELEAENKELKKANELQGKKIGFRNIKIEDLEEENQRLAQRLFDETVR